MVSPNVRGEQSIVTTFVISVTPARLSSFSGARSRRNDRIEYVEYSVLHLRIVKTVEGPLYRRYSDVMQLTCYRTNGGSIDSIVNCRHWNFWEER